MTDAALKRALERCAELIEQVSAPGQACSYRFNLDRWGNVRSIERSEVIERPKK